MKCLVVGNLTVDEVNGELRVGGSSYYGGRSLKLLGCEVYILSSISNKYRDLFENLYSEFSVIERSCPSNPVFVIRSGRAVGLKEPGCTIPPDEIASSVKSIEPSVVLLAPVFNEVVLEQSYLEMIRGGDAVLGLEIHGLTRSVVGAEILNEWRNELLSYAKYFDLVHGNLHEYCFSNSLSTIIGALREYSSKHYTGFQVSLDARGLYLVAKGSIYYFPPLDLEVVSVLGAGDVLLSVSSYYLSNGYSHLESTARGLVAAYLKMSCRDSEWFDRNAIEELVGRAKHLAL